LTKYRRWLQKYDDHESLDCLYAYINTQDLIKIKSASGHTGLVEIVFDYQRGDLMSNIRNYQMKNPTFIMFLPRQSDLEHLLKKPTKKYIADLSLIKDALIEGAFLQIGYAAGYFERGNVKGREQDFIDSIKQILRESTSDDEMRMELERLGISSPESDHIIRNNHYWLEE